LIIYVENGRIVERGTHDELLRAGGRYSALYRLHTLTHGTEVAPPLQPAVR